MAQSLSGMRLVSFPSEEVEEVALAELLRIDRDVHIVNDDKYIITQKQCEHLKTRGIDYRIDKVL